MIAASKFIELIVAVLAFVTRLSETIARTLGEAREARALRRSHARRRGRADGRHGSLA